MRLLHASKLEFEEFFEAEIPKYIILSHRWGSDEVSFENYLLRQKLHGQGHMKIEKFCDLALETGFEWVWVDTCCIDKRSSAELSEAINSMYKWYQNAQVCYAYLADVFPNTKGAYAEEDFEPWAASFKNSVWFRRGWTLQELIAPKKVLFLDGDWTRIGSRSTLAELISVVTGIDVQVCQATKSIKAFSVAQRMSWAAKRQTSKVEDLAYSLLGIFDINMPLLYGEGYKAFLRLQEEIIRYSDDESIFAWSSKNNSHGGLLAQSPSLFVEASEVRPQHFDVRRPYMITNRGLQMGVPLLEAPAKPRGTFLVPLGCSKDRQSPLAILIRRDDRRDDLFVRVACADMKAAGFDTHTPTLEDLRKQIIYVQLRPH